MVRLSVPEKEFSDYFRQALAHPLPDLTPREPKLRVSGFPFCGLKAAWMKITNHVDPDNDAMAPYYCDVGTAAHAVFQRFLGAKGRIYGNWSCLNPKCRKKVRFGADHRCPKCGSEMHYDEFEVRAFRHVSGHTDGLFKDKSGQFWVIDYKTSSIFTIENQHKLNSLPYRKNQHQIESYVPLLERELDISIAGWMLIYVARDNPTVHKVYGARMSHQRKQAILRRIRGYDAQYEVVLNLRTFKQLRYLVDNKFCLDYAHYIKHMRNMKPCPLESVCFTDRLKPTLRIAMQEYMEKL